MNGWLALYVTLIYLAVPVVILAALARGTWRTAKALRDPEDLARFDELLDVALACMRSCDELRLDPDDPQVLGVLERVDRAVAAADTIRVGVYGRRAPFKAARNPLTKPHPEGNGENR